jgi:hypothetical protein
MTATTTGGIPAAGEDGCGEDRSAPAAARMCTATTATGDGDDGDLDRSGDDGDHEGSGGTAPSHPLLSPLPDQSEGRRPSPGRTGVGRTDPPGRRCGCARRRRRLATATTATTTEAATTATTKEAAAPRLPIPSSPLSHICPMGGGRRWGGRARGGRIRPGGGSRSTDPPRRWRGEHDRGASTSSRPTPSGRGRWCSDFCEFM